MLAGFTKNSIRVNSSLRIMTVYVMKEMHLEKYLHEQEGTGMIKEQIEAELRILIGQPLTDGGRALLQWFAFGPPHTIIDPHGDQQQIGEYTLHIQCPWRITSPNGVVAGSGDLGYAAGDDPYADVPPSRLSRQGNNRCDERMRMFLYYAHHSCLVVETVHADNIGSLRIFFNAGYTLEVFPNDSLKEEYWRFCKPYIDNQHFLVTGQGIEKA